MSDAFFGGDVFSQKITVTAAHGTAGYIPVHCGFKPGKIVVRNKTTGNNLIWNEALGADGLAVWQAKTDLTNADGAIFETYISETRSGTNVTVTRPVVVMGEFPEDIVGTSVQLAAVRAACAAEALLSGGQGFLLITGYTDLTDSADDVLYVEVTPAAKGTSVNNALLNDLGDNPRA